MSSDKASNKPPLSKQESIRDLFRTLLGVLGVGGLMIGLFILLPPPSVLTEWFWKIAVGFGIFCAICFVLTFIIYICRLIWKLLRIAVYWLTSPFRRVR